MMCALGCGGGEPQPLPVELEGWTVTAATPQLSPDGAMITGSMIFARTSGAEMRGGGVCLVADLNNAAPCTTAADCAGLPLPTGGFHYCAGINGGAAKRCWTRPGGGDAYCNRSPSRAPGTYATPIVPSTVNGAATLWTSYACLAVEANPMGCGSMDPSQYTFATSPTTQATPR